MKKFTIVFLGVALFITGAIFVGAQSAKYGGNGKFGFAKHGKKFGKKGFRGNRMMKRAFRQLNLTDAQKEQIKKIKQSSRESTKSLREQIRTNRKNLRQATENGSFNESQIKSIAQKQGDLHAQMIVERQKAKAQVFGVLTPDQKTKLAEIKANFEKRMKERKKKWSERQNMKKSQS